MTWLSFTISTPFYVYHSSSAVAYLCIRIMYFFISRMLVRYHEVIQQETNFFGICNNNLKNSGTTEETQFDAVGL